MYNANDLHSLQTFCTNGEDHENGGDTNSIIEKLKYLRFRCTLCWIIKNPDPIRHVLLLLVFFLHRVFYRRERLR